MNSDQVADEVEYLQGRVTADMIKSYCGILCKGVTESTWEFATRSLRRFGPFLIDVVER